MSAAAFAVSSHVGKVRTNNEDAFGHVDGLWVVADGMGGAAGGEVASRTAVDTVLAAAPTGSDSLRAAFVAAHRAVAERARDGLAGMGTTLVAALCTTDGDVAVASVGDSRVYLSTADGLTLLTADDNEAQQLLSQGMITAKEAPTHRGQYILTSTIGAHPHDPDPTVLQIPAHAGRLMLCSDGLNSELDDARIAGYLVDGTPEEAATRLVDAAVEAGGRDNVTVVVVDL